MTEAEVKGWVAVRCVFRTTHNSRQVYEERITLWRASDMDDAIELAESEAEEHAASLSRPPGFPTQYVGLAQAYRLADQPEDGSEVFSLHRWSDLEPEAYLDAFFDTGSELQRP